MNLTLKIAETEEEKRQAYEVRYQCLTLETGDERYADHTQKTFIDNIDESGKCKLFIIADNTTGRVVASQRVVFRKDIVFPVDEIYPYKKLAEILNTTGEEVICRSALIDRSSVLKEYRAIKPSLFGRLLINSNNALKHEISNAINVNFVSVDNQRFAEGLINRFGLIPFEEKIVFDGKLFWFLWKVV